MSFHHDPSSSPAPKRFRSSSDERRRNHSVKQPVSLVEKHFLEKSGRKLRYAPQERVGVVEVDCFPELGKLTALRFIEWVQHNPGGVISLPTGKTPEHFIKWVTHYLGTWTNKDTIEDLKTYGIDTAVPPDMHSLYFVQIDDFFPMDPTQHNSFYHYVNKYYIDGFGLDRHKCLLIDTFTLGCGQGETANHVFDEGVDLHLRHCQPKTAKQAKQQHVLLGVDQFCSDYEMRIRQLGGIGFFLGGIGPDGHIAFNIRGSDHFSTTRLTETNYETQAAAAGDLGGIELARKTLVITIGLHTITMNPNVVAIIAAAGEAKATVVADTIQKESSNMYPGSVLHGVENARFYLATSACVKLCERVFEDFTKQETLSQSQMHKPVVDLALKLNSKICDLTHDQLVSDRFTAHVLTRIKVGEEEFLTEVEDSLKAKLDTPMSRMVNSSQALTNMTFLHTAPHHDDIMLGYLPYVVHLVRPRTNRHTFNYMTSGFNSVTNTYVTQLVSDVKMFIPKFHELFASGYFDADFTQGYHQDLYKTLDGVAARDELIQREGVSMRVIRIISKVFGDHTEKQVVDRCDAIIKHLDSRYPGQKDTSEYQKFKGMIREMEADLLWGYFGFNDCVNHLRLGFYKGDYFTESPTPDRDVQPILKLLHAQKPNVVTVAFDPEGSGPDTHYKVMQAVCQALRIYKEETGVENLEVWGYRNVWYKFHPVDADLAIPVSLNSMAIMDDTFNRCFGSQRSASFPSHQYDGPFSRLAQRIQAEQLQMFKVCLGGDFFEQSDTRLLQRTHGLCFLRRMSLEEFFSAARSLEQAVGPAGSRK